MACAPFKRIGCGPPPGVRQCLIAQRRETSGKIPGRTYTARQPTRPERCLRPTNRNVKPILPRPELSIRADVATLLASSLSFGPYFRFPPNLYVRYSQAKALGESAYFEDEVLRQALVAGHDNPKFSRRARLFSIDGCRPTRHQLHPTLA